MLRHPRLKGAFPGVPGKHAALAAESFAAGDLVQAERSCRRALARATTDADLWHLLAAILLASQRLADAHNAIDRARRLQPQEADYANTEALIQERRGDLDGAALSWRHLIMRAPTQADAWYNLGRLALTRGQYREAMDLLMHAVSLRPRWVDAYKNLAQACVANGDLEAAEAAFQTALRCAPQDVDSLANLARLRQEADDYPAALNYYRAALQVEVDDATLLRAALLMPTFCADSSELTQHRARIEHKLRELESRPMSFDDPARNLVTPAFYFAYQGRNDRALMSTLGGIVERAWRPPALLRAARTPRPRVAFVSAHFKEHTIARLYLPLLERLPRNAFDVAVLSIGQHGGPLATRIAACANQSVAVAEDLEAARRGLAALAPDVVVYCDLGIDPWSYYLAAERQAPVQCVTWGHPVTSGLTTVDYFISSRHVEPAGAQDHYRESLVELPSWPVLYEAPAAPQRKLERGDFGFARDEHIYLCPQSLFKLHPDFDAYLAAILRADSHGVVVLIDSRTAWRARLLARFTQTMPDVAARVRFVKSVSAADFGALLAAADVVLDTLHFSGGYTSFETIWTETPFVTESGAFMRGRVTAGLCTLLDLDEAVASGAADYATRAVTLACDAGARTRFIDKLASRKQRLLALDDSVVPAFCNFFQRALEEAARTHSQESAA